MPSFIIDSTLEKINTLKSKAERENNAKLQQQLTEQIKDLQKFFLSCIGCV